MWIKFVDEAEAQGNVKEIYERARQQYGFLPDAVKVFSLRPQVAAGQEALKRSLLGDASSLGARRADMIGAVVSGLNECSYCATAHGGLLVKRGDYDEDEALALYEDWRSLDLPDDERAMLEFAEKLTAAPWTMSEEDIEALRKVGFSEENIYDIALLTAYRNFMNRVNDALGVPVDQLRGRFSPEWVDSILAAKSEEKVPQKTVSETGSSNP